jgi:hypothetical protein
MLAKYMLSLPAEDSVIKKLWEIPIFGPYVQYKDIGRIHSDWLSKPAVDKCIYPKALMSRFGDDKLYTGSTIFSKKDDWFAKSNHQNSIKFNQKMNQLIKDNSGLYRFRAKSLSNLHGDTFAFSTAVICSQFYPLRKLPEST